MLCQLSNSCVYALLASLELAGHYGSKPLSTQEIAGKRGIPAKFLESILRELKAADLAKSSRGKEGGYSLSRPPKSISVGEVVKAIHPPKASSSGSPAIDRLSGLAADNYFGVLEASSLALLLKEESESQSVLNFSI